MEGFENVESFEEFKYRLNSLTEKLNKTSKNLNQALGEWRIGENKVVTLKETIPQRQTCLRLR
jgi:exonuclease VII small subunit